MKNSELRDYNTPSLLGGLDKQRQLILREYSVQMPCPNCATQQNYFEAMRVDIDDFDFGRSSENETAHCVGCDREIKLVVPFMKMGGPHRTGSGIWCRSRCRMAHLKQSDFSALAKILEDPAVVAAAQLHADEDVKCIDCGGSGKGTIG
jgi:hypothetical protein